MQHDQINNYPDYQQLLQQLIRQLHVFMHVHECMAI